MRPLLKKLGVAVIVALGLVYAWMMVAGPRGIPALLHKKAQIAIMDQENRDLEAEVKRRKERIRALKEDREAQELEIRKRLNKQKPGTKDFYLPESSANSSTAP
ncbi:MAG: hypothetical protein GY953_15530 [bacterium]|nr:hypothetical protein [bacterium]